MQSVPAWAVQGKLGAPPAPLLWHSEQHLLTGYVQCDIPISNRDVEHDIPPGEAAADSAAGVDGAPVRVAFLQDM